MSTMKNIPIRVHGRVTSLRLEPEYRYWLKEIAKECGGTQRSIIEGIHAAKRPHYPLASAIRVFIAGYWRGKRPKLLFPD